MKKQIRIDYQDSFTDNSKYKNYDLANEVQTSQVKELGSLIRQAVNADIVKIYFVQTEPVEDL